MQKKKEVVKGFDFRILLVGLVVVGLAVASVFLFGGFDKKVDDGNLNVPAGFGGVYRVLIVDLEPSGLYDVSVNGVKINDVNDVASRAGVIFLGDVSLNEGNVLSIVKTGVLLSPSSNELSFFAKLINLFRMVFGVEKV